MSLNVTQSNNNLTLQVSQSNVKATLSVTQNINELHITAIQNNEITKLQPVLNSSSFTETDPIFQASEASLFVAGDKANLDNQSGVNTGDETALSIQTKRPLKTINNSSLEGSGNIQIHYNDLDNLPNIPSIDNLVPYTEATQDLNLGYNTFRNNNGLITTWDNGGASFGTEYLGDAKQMYFTDSDTSGNFIYSGQSIDMLCNLEEGWGTTNWGYDFNDGTYLASTIYNNVNGARFNTRMGDNNFSQVITNAGEVALTNLTDNVGTLMSSSIRLWKDYTKLLITNDDTTEANTIEMYTDRTYTKKYVTTDEGFVGNYVQFNTAATETIEVGKIVWNQADGTFDMGLLNSVTLQAGQEMHMYAKASGAIANGDAVQFAGAQGDHLLVKKAVPSEINANPEYFVGIATQDFANNQFGYVTVFGQVRELNTSMYSGGTVLYYQSSGSTAGLLTNVRPTGPLAKITVAAVVRSHNNQGAIFVRPHVMPRIDALQDVVISAATSGDVLTYNSSTQVWENKSLNEITGEFNYIMTTPVSYSGTAAETEVLRLEIPPYTFAANDMLKIPTLLVQKVGTVNSYTIRVKLSTSATMPPTTTDLIAAYSPSATVTNVNMSRTWFLSGGILRGLGNSNAVTDGIGSTIQLNVAFDRTITNYLYISIDSAGGQDTQTLVGFQLTNR